MCRNSTSNLDHIWIGVTVQYGQARYLKAVPLRIDIPAAKK